MFSLGWSSVGCIEGGAAEVIGLKDGHEVTGEVVAEKTNALFVDLGFDIVRIPRDQVVRRGKPGEADPATVLAREPETEASGFFSLGPLLPRSRNWSRSLARRSSRSRLPRARGRGSSSMMMDMR